MQSAVGGAMQDAQQTASYPLCSLFVLVFIWLLDAAMDGKHTHAIGHCVHTADAQLRLHLPVAAAAAAAAATLSIAFCRDKLPPQSSEVAHTLYVHTR